MHGIYELKEMLCKELEEYGQKELTAGSLDVIDKLAHTVKNLDKIIEGEEYGQSYDEASYTVSGRGGSYRNSYDGSYARGRGRSARRDSRGRYSGDGYSREGDMVDKLRDLMEEAPDERTKQEIRRLISKMEQG